MSVEWRPIPGFPLYEVSTDGQVRSLMRDRPHTLRPVSSYGYPRVVLYLGRRRVHKRVHQLVALAFIGPVPEGMEVRHLNGDRADAQLSNLAYGTHAENMQDRLRHGTNWHANRTHCRQGHPYNEQNTYVTPSGKRDCRTCRGAASRRAAERRRLQKQVAA
jgi:hypothetical protein